MDQGDAFKDEGMVDLVDSFVDEFLHQIGMATGNDNLRPSRHRVGDQID